MAERLKIDLSGEFPLYLHEAARKTARFLSTAMETIVVNKLPGFKPAGNVNDVYDLLTHEGEKVEVRTVTDKTLISFEASVNVGAGRDGTHKQATLDKLQQIDLWLFCNVSRFPVVEVTCLRKLEVLALCATKTRKQFSAKKAFNA